MAHECNPQHIIVLAVDGIELSVSAGGLLTGVHFLAHARDYVFCREGIEFPEQ